ncbi:MAG: hypothetical protein AAGA10_29190 [Bacteroidota bacterium]
MDWESTLQYGIPAVCSALVMHYMTRLTQKEIPRQADGSLTLRMNRLYQVLGYIALGIGVVVLVASFGAKEEGKEIEILMAQLVILLLFGGGGIYLIMGYSNTWLSFNEDHIRSSTWMGEIKEIHWKDIEQIRYKSLSGYLVIKGKNEKIKAFRYFVGFQAFINEMEEQTKWTREELEL